MQPLFVSVNVSSRQLFRPELINEVRHILGRAVIPKGSLRLEITESLVMENPEKATAVLSQLAAAGAGLSLDDFGTGYSSLSYLNQFTFDTIKIDRSFVQAQRRRTAPASVILRSIVALAHELGKKVVAEGVETEDDVGFLRSIGCEYGQGFYYGEPMSEREVMQLLKVVRRAERRKSRKSGSSAQARPARKKSPAMPAPAACAGAVNGQPPRRRPRRSSAPPANRSKPPARRRSRRPSRRRRRPGAVCVGRKRPAAGWATAACPQRTPPDLPAAPQPGFRLARCRRRRCGQALPPSSWHRAAPHRWPNRWRSQAGISRRRQFRRRQSPHAGSNTRPPPLPPVQRPRRCRLRRKARRRTCRKLPPAIRESLAKLGRANGTGRMDEDSQRGSGRYEHAQPAQACPASLTRWEGSMPIFDSARSYFWSRSRSNSRSSVGRTVQPAVGLDLALELTRAPARVTERQDRPVGPLAAGDGLQDVDGGRERHAVVDRQRRIGSEIVGAVQHEAASGLDRSANVHVHVDRSGPPRRCCGRDAQLPRSSRKADVRRALVDDQTHGALG